MVSITSLSEGDRFIAQLGTWEIAVEVVTDKLSYTDGVEVRKVDVKTGELSSKARITIDSDGDDSELQFRSVSGRWRANELKAVREGSWL